MANKKFTEQEMLTLRNSKYQWDLARLSPVEYYQYMTTGIYPLIIPKAKGENNQSEASL